MYLLTYPLSILSKLFLIIYRTNHRRFIVNKNLKKLDSPFDLDWLEYSKLRDEYGSRGIDAEVKKVKDLRYNKSVLACTQKCCDQEMIHIGDRCDGSYTGDCFRPGIHSYTYYHVYQCDKCQNIEEKSYCFKEYEDDNR